MYVNVLYRLLLSIALLGVFPIDTSQASNVENTGISDLCQSPQFSEMDI